MVKKLLFILLLTLSSIAFSQEKSIEKLSAAPNPFTNSTKISFTAANNSTVFFKVKDVLGKTVHKKTFKAEKGINYIPFEKGDLQAGVYIYSIHNTKKIISKRLVIQ